MSGVINVLERVVIRHHYISARPDVRVFCCVPRATMAVLPTKTIGKVVLVGRARLHRLDRDQRSQDGGSPSAISV
jgi:hypothetical protein